jgi:serine/threonine protein kinase/tetratricopeptide (TPR) repeat protein
MIGRTLGQYVVIDRLGAGGMGEVYRARDTKLEREVALKVVTAPAPGSSDTARGLRKEALALSRLNHPNIATVYDFDVIGGAAFVVMELVPGIDLRDRMRGGPLGEKETLDLAVQAADALDAAHAAGVVHRDLKPGNIRVTPEGRLKILDFGLATREARPGERASTTALSLNIPGTLPYMAPEQLRGQPADPRSDIYALAVVLYEMAVGKQPFEAKTDALLVDQMLNAPPVAPHDRNPRVSPGFDAIVMKGLEKDPRRRYQSAREMLIDLERLRAPSPSATSHRRVEGRRALPSAVWKAAAAVGVVAALSLGVWAGLRLLTKPSQPLAFAARDWILVSDFDNQTGESMFDSSLFTALNVGLAQSTYANVVSKARVDEALARMGRKDAPRIDEALGREICVREGIRGLLVPGISRVGQQYLLTARLVDPGSGAAVRAYFERADRPDEILGALGRIATGLRGDLGESLASISRDSKPLPQVTTASLEALRSYTDGLTLWQKGQHREALVHYTRAVELDPDFAMAHAALGNAHLSFVFNNSEAGRRHYDRALALADRATERERMILRANYESALGDRQNAVDLYKALLFRYPDDATAHYNFASLLRRLGRYDEAIVQYEETIRLSPTNAGAYINLATAQGQAGRSKEALVAYDRAFALEPGWKAGGNLNHEYGFALVRAGRADDGRRVFALTETSTEERPRGLRSMALLDMYQGKYRAAIDRLQEAIRLDGPLDRPLTEARDQVFLATALEAVGQRQQSVAALKTAARILATLDGVAFLVRAGVGLARAGELAQAEQTLSLARKKMVDAADRAELQRFEAEVLLARQRTDEAIDLITSIPRLPDAQPALVAESLANALAKSSRIEEAIVAYNAFLGIDAIGWEPQHAWLEAHYRLAQLQLKRNGAAAARSRLDTLLSLWSDGDADLPTLVAAKRLRAEIADR